MLWALIGTFIGILIGIIINFSIPIEFIKYTAVIIIGIIDSILGAVKAEVKGISNKDKYSALIFTTGLLTNISVAVIITFLGEYLGLDLYLAVTVVFTLRIFTNIAKIRRGIIDRYFTKK